MSLATIDADGLPNVRMVLMKGFDERGFVFFTNVDSQKGRSWTAAARPPCWFHWKSLNRQVRLRGPVERVEDAAADAFRDAAAPHPDRRLGQQAIGAGRKPPRPGADRVLRRQIRLGAVPRPPNWTGYRLRPLLIEFWEDRPFRLHDRVEFQRDAFDAPWRKTRLYP